jgi:hypothetical protein
LIKFLQRRRQGYSLSRLFSADDSDARRDIAEIGRALVAFDADSRSFAIGFGHLDSFAFALLFDENNRQPVGVRIFDDLHDLERLEKVLVLDNVAKQIVESHGSFLSSAHRSLLSVPA